MSHVESGALLCPVLQWIGNPGCMLHQLFGESSCLLNSLSHRVSGSVQGQKTWVNISAFVQKNYDAIRSHSCVKGLIWSQENQ